MQDGDRARGTAYHVTPEHLVAVQRSPFLFSEETFPACQKLQPVCFRVLEQSLSPLQALGRILLTSQLL